jgi:AAA15 family ATPase/GTPase
MLISYSVENFKTFKEKQTLYMQPIKKYSSKSLLDNLFQTGNKNEPELLKSACIYGANASGKTKFLQSILNFWEIIFKFRQVGYFMPYFPFAFDKESNNKPTRYEIEFLLKNSVYKYNML